MEIAAMCYIGVMWFVLLIYLWSTGFVKKPNGAYLAGITIPQEHREDACVKQVIKTYEGRVRVLFFSMGAGAFFVLLLKQWLSAQLFFLTAWLTVFVFWQYFVDRRTIREMYAVKKENGWGKKTDTEKVVLVDTRVSRMKATMPVSMWTMIVPLWLSVSLTFWWLLYGEGDKGAGVFTATVLFTTILGFVLFRIVSHARVRVYSEDTEINLCINRVSRRAWTGCIAWEVALHTLYAGGAALYLHYGKGTAFYLVVPVTIVVCVLALVPMLSAYQKVSRVKKELLNGLPPLAQDEDEYWLDGLYRNPEDPSAFVEPRIGIGLTVNFAKPSMKYLMYGSLLFALILCIGAAVFCIPLDFAKISLKEQAETFVVSGGGYSETVEYEEICEIKLLTGMPSALRTWGSATEDYLFGEYYLSDIGNADVFVKRNQEVFLLLERTSGRYLLLALETEEETKGLYETLTR